MRPSKVITFVALLPSLACSHVDIQSVQQSAQPPTLAPSTKPAPDALPRVVDIATATQAMNIYYEYALADGLLYQRKLGDTQWTLTDGIGLPNKDGELLPELKGKLTRVFADGNVVQVVDEADQVFRVDSALSILDVESSLYAWRYSWGGGMLKMRKDLRAVSYARRTILNVGVVEDRYGYELLAANPSSLMSVFHDNGYSGLMHFYGLSSDGTRLLFADNGLKPVFNYEFDLPHEDDFVGVSIASSGSMVVILDDKGRLWAKLLDFDWNGSNPMMFEYAYADKGGARRKNGDALEGFGRVHLPMPPWRELPRPPEGLFSTEMSMVVTGLGNNARELRMRGFDDSGKCGLHVISLEKNEWSFRETGICPTERFVKAERPKLPTRFSTLTGTLTIDGVRYRATMSEYSLADSPARLELRNDSNEIAFKGAIHLVPAWTPVAVQDPGRDGRYKMFHATLDADEDFKKGELSRRYNLETFAFIAYGAQDEIVLKPLSDDLHLGKLKRRGAMSDVVATYLVNGGKGVRALCEDVGDRVRADKQLLSGMTAATPPLNLFGVVTGTRFWYEHGVSMIPPLGRMMEWGTRLIIDRYDLTRYEDSLVRKHCGT
jgi:hypothetical protein